MYCNKKVFILSILIILFTSTLYAGFTISPARIEERVSPGEIVKGIYKIKNNGEESIKLAIKSRYWYLAEENKDIKIPDWLTFEDYQFELEEGKTKELKFKINVPEKARGFLMAMNSFSSESSGNSMLNLVYSVPIYAIIKGTEVVEPEIVKFNMAQNTKKNVVFTSVGIKNNGNIYLRPRGEILVETKKGKKIKTIEIPEGWPVFPGEEKAYTGKWMNPEIEPGKYKVTAHISFTNIEEDIQKEFKIKVNRKGYITVK